MSGTHPAEPHANFLGVRVEAVTFDELDGRLADWLADKSQPARHVACLNAYCVTLASRDPELARIYNSADLAGPDGMPFTLWIRWVLGRRCDRFYGPDVMLHLAERARDTGHTFYLYGGAPDVLEALETRLRDRFGHLRVVGRRSPPFRPLSEAEDREVCDEINALAPDVVCVGLGTPKQDHWIGAHRERIRGSVLIAVGAAFDFLGGRVRQAPRFVQRSGFEWLWRLASRDFGRLWRRYTLANAEFVGKFALQTLGLRPRPIVDGRRPR